MGVPSVDGWEAVRTLPLPPPPADCISKRIFLKQTPKRGAAENKTARPIGPLGRGPHPEIFGETLMNRPIGFARPKLVKREGAVPGCMYGNEEGGRAAETAAERRRGRPGAVH